MAPYITGTVSTACASFMFCASKGRMVRTALNE